MQTEAKWVRPCITVESHTMFENSLGPPMAFRGEVMEEVEPLSGFGYCPLPSLHYIPFPAVSHVEGMDNSIYSIRYSPLWLPSFPLSGLFYPAQFLTTNTGLPPLSQPTPASDALSPSMNSSLAY